MKKIHGRKIFYFVAQLIAIMVIATMLLTWGWNNSVAVIWEMPRIQQREALGLVVLASMTALLFSKGGRAQWHKGGTSI